MLTSKQFGGLLSAKCFERNYSITSYGKTQTNFLANPTIASFGSGTTLNGATSNFTLTCSVVLVSGVQQSESVMHISTLFQLLSPCRPLQSIDQSSLCYTAGPFQLSISHIAVSVYFGGFPGGSAKDLPAMQETWVQSLGPEDPLEQEVATHSSILAWEIPGGSMGSQRVGHDLATKQQHVYF